MISWAGGKISNGKIHYWINWARYETEVDQPLFGVLDFPVPNNLRAEILDSSRSGYLMPVPIERWN